MESKILLLCFFLASIGDTAQERKNFAVSKKTKKDDSAKRLKIRSKIKAAKLSESISVTKSVRKKIKRKITLNIQENLCEDVHNLVGM